MVVRVSYFAIVREKVGLETEDFALQHGATVGDLRAELTARHPALDGLMGHLRTAVNHDFVGTDHRLRAGDEVALIPPVAGGSDIAALTDQPLDPGGLVDRVRSDRQGAVVTFVGVVRDNNQGRAVSFLEYEAYPPMAEAKLAEILAEAREKWPGCQVAVSHRTGRLEVGDAAVAIAAASAHRREAFAACEYVIDRIKQDVPIWKREVGPDGEQWVGMGS